MSEIKAILFDFGGTLDSDGVDWFTRLYGAIANGRASIDRNSFDRWANEAANSICKVSDPPSRRAIPSQLTMRGTVLKLCEHVYDCYSRHNGDGEATWTPEQIADDFVERSISHIMGNRSVLKQLSGRFRLGCISNNWGNTAGWCSEFGLTEFFEVIIDSTVVDLVKPDEGIFRKALDKLSLPASDCVYVGDRYDCDVLGSHSVGMKPIWIAPSQAAQPDDNVPCYRIERLSELSDHDRWGQ